MPLDLAVLAVEAGLVSAEGIGRALARQRELGGALETALLELGLVDESELIRLVSRAAGIPPPPEWRLGRVEPEEPIRAAAARAAEALDATAILRDVIEAPPVPEEPPGWSFRQAAEALDGAQDRDQVLAVALRYAREFVEASAVFAITRHEVAGVDAVGWPGARARCRAIRIPRPGTGLLRAVIETRGPYLGPITHEPGNEALLARLGRSWPAMALAYPVVLRERVVCVLYADNGDAPVSPRRIGELLLLGGALAPALERVVRASKSSRDATPAVEVRDEGGWVVSEAARLAPPDRAVAHPPDAFRAVCARDALASIPRPR